MPIPRQFPDARILAAVALYPNSLRKSAKEARVAPVTVQTYLKRMDAVAGGCVIERNFRTRKVADRQIKWTDANRAKLAALFALVPCPSNEEIAEKMGTTAAAIMTAKTRLGLGKRKLVANKKWLYSREYVQVNPQRVIACLNCLKPFGSHGIGNRLCIKCFGVGSLNNEEERHYG